MREKQPGESEGIGSPLLEAADVLHTFLCFRLTRRLLVSVACVLFTCIVIFLLYHAAAFGHGSRRVVEYSGTYFFCCFLGGILSGIPHLLMTPVDLVKCRMQVGEYATLSDGFRIIYGDSNGSLWNAVTLFFRGWVPTLFGYSFQGGLKFFFYELFKFLLHGHHSVVKGTWGGVEHERSTYLTKMIVYVVASFFAEMLADLALAPWEAVKIKIQTTSVQRTQIWVIFRMVWAAEGFNGFYKGITTLWCRQVPYTVVKFVSFENIVHLLYVVFLTTPSHTAPRRIQLLFSLIAGVLAGVLCAIVSHPADTILSKLNQRTDTVFTASKNNPCVMMQEIGWHGVWKGVGPRVLMVGTLTAMQWLLYDTFKLLVGIPTTGSGGSHHS